MLGGGDPCETTVDGGNWDECNWSGMCRGHCCWLFAQETEFDLSEDAAGHCVLECDVRDREHGTEDWGYGRDENENHGHDIETDSNSIFGDGPVNKAI